MIYSSVFGRLGSDPLTKNVNGQDVTEFSIASTLKRKDKEVTTWVNCVMWGPRGSVITKYVKKGDQLLVQGSLFMDEYTSANGTPNKRIQLSVTDFSLISQNQPQVQPQQTARAESVTTNPALVSSLSDGDLPF